MRSCRIRKVLFLNYGIALMKNDKWELVLEQIDGDVIIDSYPNKKLAEQERESRNRLCVAMGYTPDVKYIIRKV